MDSEVVALTGVGSAAAVVSAVDVSAAVGADAVAELRW